MRLCRRCGCEIYEKSGGPYDNGMHSSRDATCQSRGRALQKARADKAEAELREWREASGLSSTDGPVPSPGDFQAYRNELEQAHVILRESYRAVCDDRDAQMAARRSAEVERDALKLELARLKSERGQPRWYAVTHVGFQHCPSEQAARERAEWSIGTYRDLCDPEWDLEVEAVEYGRVIPVGVARVVSRTCAHDEGDDTETVNYALVDPATYTEPTFVDCGECEDYEEEVEP